MKNFIFLCPPTERRRFSVAVKVPREPGIAANKQQKNLFTFETSESKLAKLNRSRLVGIDTLLKCKYGDKTNERVRERERVKPKNKNERRGRGKQRVFCEILLRRREVVSDAR